MKHKIILAPVNKEKSDNAVSSVLDIETKRRETKFVFDPNNVSSFYAINTDLLKMPVISIKSYDNIDLPGFRFGREWAVLINQISSRFPKNRLIIKKQLEDLYNMNLDNDADFTSTLTKLQDMSPEEIQQLLNDKKAQSIMLKSMTNLKGPQDSREGQHKKNGSNSQSPTRRKTVKIKEKDMLLEFENKLIKINAKKMLGRLDKKVSINKTLKRRNSCTCQWCGGESAIERKMHTNPLILMMKEWDKFDKDKNFLTTNIIERDSNDESPLRKSNFMLLRPSLSGSPLRLKKMTSSVREDPSPISIRPEPVKIEEEEPVKQLIRPKPVKKPLPLLNHSVQVKTNHSFVGNILKKYQNKPSLKLETEPATSARAYNNPNTPTEMIVTQHFSRKVSVRKSDLQFDSSLAGQYYSPLSSVRNSTNREKKSELMYSFNSSLYSHQNTGRYPLVVGKEPMSPIDTKLKSLSKFGDKTKGSFKQNAMNDFISSKNKEIVNIYFPKLTKKKN